MVSGATPKNVVCGDSSNTDKFTAYLDGSKSSASGGETLTYDWSFTYKPEGSKVELLDATTANPSFVPDLPGTYTVQLVVSAGGVSSPRAIAVVIALDDTHVPSNFHGGVSSNCVNCHNDSNPTLEDKSGNHITTSNVCQACHTTFGFNVATFVDHNEVFGKCSSCHDGVIATGKSAHHVATTAECSDCHDTTSFLTLSADGSFDHSTITEPCSACHNGVTAIGTDSDPNPSGHPSIGAKECNTCHTTASFSTPFPDHTDLSIVEAQCGQSGCHDGKGIATGKPASHPATGDITIACDLCHNVTSFNLNGLFDHSVLARHPESCISCHDGVNATGMIAGHIALPSPASDCGDCHNTTTFVGGFVDHTSAEVTGAQCVDCHDGTHDHTIVDATGAVITLPIPGKPVDHVPTGVGQSCGDCHTAGGSFSLATIDHSVLVEGTDVCSTCHNNSIATGKPDNHIATTEDCYLCHSKDKDTFAGGTFDHGGVDLTDCASCHDGVTATGKSGTHVPTADGLDCSACHSTSNFTSFVITTFDHGSAGITDNCASCHNGHYYDGVLVIDKPSNHIPTVNDCSQCHNDTTNGPAVNGTPSSGFATAAAFDNTVHPAIVTGCGGCHNGKFPPALGMDSATNHIPTTQDCNICHKNDMADAFKTSIFSHAGITNNCASCHDGKHTDSNALGKSATHIATPAGEDCGACHSISGNFTDGSFDHTTIAAGERCDSCHIDNNTTSPLGKNTATHIATTEDCGFCHEAGGSFATAVFDHSTLSPGTRCDSCHNDTSSATAIGPSPTHIAIPLDASGLQPEDCSACHNTTAFAGAQFDHSTLTSGTLCGSCHDGVSATGKTTYHVPTIQDCGVCHVTAGFLPATFDHTGPEAAGKACSDCHDGLIATGKTPGHVATNQDCGACHTTDSFIPATTFDHTGVVDGCAASDCHGDGSPNVNKASYPNHIPTDNTVADCHFCHTIGTFANATMDHSVVTVKNTCSTCHDGTKATGQSSGHFVTTQECDACHTSTTDWTTTSYKHSSGGDYPGDHSTRKVPTCDTCHTDNKEVITSFRNSTYHPECAACHSNKYKTNDHGGASLSSHANCGKSGCHRVSSSSF